MNLPKKWIAGPVYDSEADECTQGAKVTATNQETGEKVSVTTDHYGDFRLEDFPDGTYVLLVEEERYLTRKLGPVDAGRADQNLGDVALWRV